MSLTTWHRKAILAGTWKWCGKQALLIGEVDCAQPKGDLAKAHRLLHFYMECPLLLPQMPRTASHRDGIRSPSG